jgi:hypothetical protein
MNFPHENVGGDFMELNIFQKVADNFFQRRLWDDMKRVEI